MSEEEIEKLMEELKKVIANPLVKKARLTITIEKPQEK